MRIHQLTLCTLFAAMLAGPALAAGGNNECPVYLVEAANGQTLDQEFGAGAQELTRCLKKRHQVKVVVQLNQWCSSTGMIDVQDPNGPPGSTIKTCKKGSAYGLNNIQNMINDYEETNGMVRGRDYEIVAVVHSGGGSLVLKDGGLNGSGGTNVNQNASVVQGLMEQGVKFYFCQNTTRGYIKNKTLPSVGDPGTPTEGGATAQIIEGVQYSTAGLTSIPDFEAHGYQYVQP